MSTPPLEPDFDQLETHSFVIAERVAGKRLDAYLRARFSDYSRTFLSGLVSSGHVTIDGRSVKPSTKVRAGQRVDITLPALAKPEIPADDIALSILHEDEFLVAVDKPAGMVVHPARGNWTGTLTSALAYHFQSPLAQIWVFVSTHILLQSAVCQR